MVRGIVPPQMCFGPCIAGSGKLDDVPRREFDIEPIRQLSSDGMRVPEDYNRLVSAHGVRVIAWAETPVWLGGCVQSTKDDSGPLLAMALEERVPPK
jgi:hypothetical protein